MEENGAVEIARCSRGQYFGELALVTNKPRAASAHAIGTVKCLGRTHTGGPASPGGVFMSACYVSMLYRLLYWIHRF